MATPRRPTLVQIEERPLAFAVVTPRPGAHWWDVAIADGNAAPPRFRWVPPKSGRVELDALVRAGQGQCDAFGSGWVTLTEYRDGVPTFAARYRVGLDGAGVGLRVCVWSTDPARAMPVDLDAASARRGEG